MTDQEKRDFEKEMTQLCDQERNKILHLFTFGPFRKQMEEDPRLRNQLFDLLETIDRMEEYVKEIVKNE